MLVFQYKTLDGATRRMRFENAHSRTHSFSLVWCDENGQELGAAVDRAANVRMYRLRKERRPVVKDVLT